MSYANSTRATSIENNFTHHPLRDQGQVKAYEVLRGLMKGVAHAVNEMCPDSREKDLAIYKLEEAMMWANAAIARNQI